MLLARLPRKLDALLLTLRVVDSQRFERVFEGMPLEVVLVDARSPAPPEQAQAIAQGDLAGGGQADGGRATSALPPSALTTPGDTPQETRRQIREMQEQQTQLLAEVEKRIDEENARPERRHVIPSTREEVYAICCEQLRRRLETRGTQSFPEHQGQKPYGELTMVITAEAKGPVMSTEVVQPSASAALGCHSEAIVRAASTFGDFSPAMRANADQIAVVQRFHFTCEEGMETRLLNPH